MAETDKKCGSANPHPQLVDQLEVVQHLGSSELMTLLDIGEAVTSDLSFENMIVRLESGIKRLVDADAALFVMTELGRELEIIGGSDLKRWKPVSSHHDLCADVAADVASTGRTRCQACVLNSAGCRFLPMAFGDGGHHHLISVPLLRKGKPIGSITAIRQNRDNFSNKELRLLETFASIAANAIGNSLAYERERHVAETLQVGLLPKNDFAIPGFAVGSSYRAATVDSKIGGDVYDVVNLGSGRFGILMADVSGKGIGAAMHTAMVKYLARGLLLSKVQLPEVLSRLNEAVLQELPDDAFVTLFLGLLDAERRELVYANAGHDQPLLYVRKTSHCLPCDVTGLALGADSKSAYTVSKARFASGDVLILYTDGVTEARRGKAFLGIDGLERFIMKNIDMPPDELVKRVFARVVRFTRQRLQDDAAILAIKAL